MRPPLGGRTRLVVIIFYALGSIIIIIIIIINEGDYHLFQELFMRTGTIRVVLRKSAMTDLYF